MTAKAPYGRVLFADDLDREMYMRLLTAAIEQSGWHVLSHCQMTNHVHLLIRTAETNLGRGMKALHERFATHVNRRHRQYGHVFGARFANRLVLDDRHFHACLRYIARNPVEAGMCATAADWPWSAHRALLGLGAADACVAVDETLGLLGGSQGAGRIAYQQLLAPDTEALVARWASGGDDSWMPAAVEGLGLSISDLARVLGLHPSSVARRLAAARRMG